jgi:hypothetical protein
VVSNWCGVGSVGCAWLGHAEWLCTMGDVVSGWCGVGSVELAGLRHAAWLYTILQLIDVCYIGEAKQSIRMHSGVAVCVPPCHLLHQL